MVNKNISIVGKNKRCYLPCFEVPQGPFTGRMNSLIADEKLYLRTYDGIVDLANPNSTWVAKTEGYGPDIYDYRPVSITITVGEPVV